MSTSLVCPKCGQNGKITGSVKVDLATGIPVKGLFLGVMVFLLGFGFAVAGGWYTITFLKVRQLAVGGINLLMPIFFLFWIALILLRWGGKVISQRLRGDIVNQFSNICPSCNHSWKSWEPGAKVYEGIEQDWQLRALKTTGGKLRQNAIMELGLIGDEKAIAPLIEVLEDRDAAKVMDRVEAIKALQMIGEEVKDARIEAAIEKSLDDSKPVQLAATKALEEIRD